MISWASRKPNSIALNTAKAEYIAPCDACREAVWICKLIFGLFDQVLDLIMIYYDNMSCVKLSKNHVFHYKSKHIEIKYYFIHDKVQKGEVILHYISTDKKIANVLTKPLSKINFAYLRDKLRLVEINPLVEREVVTSSVGREC
jgi:hypothetical protein